MVSSLRSEEAAPARISSIGRHMQARQMVIVWTAPSWKVLEMRDCLRIPMKAASDSDGKAATHSDPKRPLFQRSDWAGVIVAVG